MTRRSLLRGRDELKLRERLERNGLAEIRVMRNMEVELRM